MTFEAAFVNAARKIQTTIWVWAPISLRPHRVRTRYTEARPNPSKLRLQVLRRDRYRCRNCNRMGDEITLEVSKIRPCAATIEEMLTLCVHCRDLAEQRDITAGNIHGFLELLRDRISSAVARQL